MLLSNCGTELKPRILSPNPCSLCSISPSKINHGPQMAKETVPLYCIWNGILPSFVQSACSCHMWMTEDRGRGQVPAVTIQQAASRTGFWSPWDSGLIWLPSKSAECMPPDLSAHLEDPTVFLWKDQPKVLRVSRACVTHCSTKHILHWIEFPLLYAGTLPCVWAHHRSHKY